MSKLIAKLMAQLVAKSGTGVDCVYTVDDCTPRLYQL